MKSIVETYLCWSEWEWPRGKYFLQAVSLKRRHVWFFYSCPWLVCHVFAVNGEWLSPHHHGRSLLFPLLHHLCVRDVFYSRHNMWASAGGQSNIHSAVRLRPVQYRQRDSNEHTLINQYHLFSHEYTQRSIAINPNMSLSLALPDNSDKSYS